MPGPAPEAGRPLEASAQDAGDGDAGAGARVFLLDLSRYEDLPGLTPLVASHETAVVFPLDLARPLKIVTAPAPADVQEVPTKAPCHEELAPALVATALATRTAQAAARRRPRARDRRGRRRGRGRGRDRGAVPQHEPRTVDRGDRDAALRRPSQPDGKDGRVHVACAGGELVTFAPPGGPRPARCGSSATSAMTTTRRRGERDGASRRLRDYEQASPLSRRPEQIGFEITSVHM